MTSEDVTLIAIEKMVGELALAVADNDLVVCSRLYKAITLFADKDPTVKSVIHSKANQELMDTALHFIQKWRAGLKDGDYAFLESPEEHVWYRVKINSINDMKIAVHFDKWDAKYDKEYESSSITLLPDGAMLSHKQPKAKPVPAELSSSSNTECQPTATTAAATTTRTTTTTKTESVCLA